MPNDINNGPTPSGVVATPKPIIIKSTISIIEAKINLAEPVSNFV